MSTEEPSILNSSPDDPDSSENNDMASENAVIKDNGGDGDANSDDTIPFPSDLVETRDNALTQAQLKK